MKKILCIIPARGGSKGIPKKNIVEVGGKPLIAYSTELGANLVGKDIVKRAIVSTDSREIADIAMKYGGDVPFIRPGELASDQSKSIDFVHHAIDFLQTMGEEYDDLLILQPTSPLRECSDIKEAFEIYNKQEADSLVSVCRESHNTKAMYHNVEGIGQPLDPNHAKGSRRQEHKPIFIRNGAIYITNLNYLLKTDRIISDHPALYEMSKMKSINLDDLSDLELLRCIMR